MMQVHFPPRMLEGKQGRLRGLCDKMLNYSEINKNRGPLHSFFLLLSPNLM